MTSPQGQDQVSASLIERAARAIAEVHGVDPDDAAPLGYICGPNNEPVAWWRYYEEDAEAALKSTPPPAVSEVREAVALVCMRWRCDLDDGDWPVAKCKDLLKAASEPHFGDCTKAPMTCLRCEAESAYKMADQITDIIAYRIIPHSNGEGET